MKYRLRIQYEVLQSNLLNEISAVISLISWPLTLVTLFDLIIWFEVIGDYIAVNLAIAFCLQLCTGSVCVVVSGTHLV